MVTRFFQRELETGFDAQSFLDGAKDAFWISMFMMVELLVLILWFYCHEPYASSSVPCNALQLCACCSSETGMR